MGCFVVSALRATFSEHMKAAMKAKAETEAEGREREQFARELEQAAREVAEAEVQRQIRRGTHCQI